MQLRRQKVLEALNSQGIVWEMSEHPAVFTIEEMEHLHICEQGEVCKNLFLRDAKGRRHFLVSIQKDKKVDLSTLSGQLDSTKLSFASADRLEKYLGLSKGEVSPLGILNDREATVEVVLDSDLKGCMRLGVHPNENTATVWLAFEDLVRLIENNGNSVKILKI